MFLLLTFTLLALAHATEPHDVSAHAHDDHAEHEHGHTHAAHKCIHEKIQALVGEPIVDEQPYSAYATPEDARKRQTTVATAPLRVYFDTFNLGSQ